MDTNHSPWLHQLKVTRPVDRISSDMETDIAVVGAGIAGIMTAYFVLKYTDKSVILIEGSRVAHGATGHNAGQIVSDFEKGFAELVREFGMDKAADAERSVRSVWVLLEEIYQEAALSTPLSSFMGYDGFCSIEHMVEEIRSSVLRLEAGLQTYPIYVAKEIAHDERFLKEYRDLYEVVPRSDIASLLETDDENYIGATSTKKGCINSAMLSEEIVGYLLAKYAERFKLFEHSPISTVNLDSDKAVLDVSVIRDHKGRKDLYKLEAKGVVLCTNGFERIKLINNAGSDIDAKFHHMVNGDVSYMSAYLEDLKEPPTALAYHDRDVEFDANKLKNPLTAPAYYYMTRRPYEIEKNETHNLICIGGPEKQIPETQNYDRQEAFSKEMGDKIDEFVKRTLKKEKKRDLEYKFQWHGIMCFTPTGMRVVGPEPKNPVLMYNLGCNGVGIMASIYGGSKIAKMIAGETFPPSVFDPKK